MSRYLSEPHDVFVKKLKKSQKAVEFFGEYLEASGLKVNIPDLRIAPNEKERHKFSDNGDLFVIKEDGEKYSVEVKHLGINFTGKDDYPYPKILVNSYPGWHTKKDKPAIHVLLSKNRQNYITVDSETFDDWKLEAKWDSVKRQKLKFYFVDIDLVEFHVIDETLL